LVEQTIINFVVDTISWLVREDLINLDIIEGALGLAHNYECTHRRLKRPVMALSRS